MGHQITYNMFGKIPGYYSEDKADHLVDTYRSFQNLGIPQSPEKLLEKYLELILD